MPFVNPTSSQVNVVVLQSDRVIGSPVVGVATTTYDTIGDPPSVGGVEYATMIDESLGDALIRCGTPGSPARTTIVLVTAAAAPYLLSAALVAVTSQVPGASSVANPVEETEHAVPVTEKERERPLELEASSWNAGSPSRFSAGWVNEIVWFMLPTAIVCVAASAGLKFALPACRPSWSGCAPRTRP